MTLDVQDLMGSTDSSSNDSDNNSQTETTTKIELAPVFDDIGADKDRVRKVIKEQDIADAMENLAKRLQEDDDLWELQEEYRRYTDLKRILQGYLYDHDGDFSAFADQFWGDSDSPAEGTFNYVQQKSRDSDGNLFYYKTMFPEPVEEYWDGEAVLWTERPDDDSHIYVTEQFVENFGQFTMEVNGEQVPRPPTASELSEMEDESDTQSQTEQSVPIDTTEHTIPELEAAIEDAMPGLSVEQTENLLTHEKANKDRKGAKEAIHAAIDAAEQLAERDVDTSDKDDESPEARAGRLIGAHNLDVSPDFIVGVLKGNPEASDSEIVEMCK
jgi:hypothetical protein